MVNDSAGAGTAAAVGASTTEQGASTFDDRPLDLGARIQNLLHARPTLGPLAVLLVALVVFASLNSRFLGAANLSLVLQQVTVVAVLSLGQTLIILTAGIDLSVGSIAVFTSILMATLAATGDVGFGLPGPVALLAGFALGTLMGVVNGLLVTRLRLQPFIVTLGTYSIFAALNLYVSGSETVRGSDMPELMVWTGNTIEVGGFSLTYGSLILVALLLAFVYTLSQTPWGRHVYATGDDLEAARLAGIQTDRVLLSVYAVAGAIYALGAWILIGRLASASPNVDNGLNLQTITAVVLGGTSLFGGRGGVVGTLIGALIVGVFANGLSLAGVDPLWQLFATGVLVIVAVSMDQWIRKVKG